MARHGQDRVNGHVSAVVGALFLGLAGCAHVTNGNQALCGSGAPCSYSPTAGYRFDPSHLKDNLIVLTFSGGGMRATALAYGTLKALEALPAPDDPTKSLLDEVDIISSVSGGSVTTGWYALNGKNQLDVDHNALDRFIDNGAQSQLLLKALNPVTMARYAFTPYQRSDVLRDTFAYDLFGDNTFAEVEQLYQGGHQPFVILNATDAGHETRFPFTQNRFDLICSDLTQYPLAYAVASSANFPPVFTAVGVHNYSGEGCPVKNDPTWTTRGPLKWIRRELDPRQHDTIVTSALITIRAAREARDYLCPRGGNSQALDAQFNPDLCDTSGATNPQDSDGRTIHLFDGGLADNLGIQSTLALEDSSEVPPGLYLRLGNQRVDPTHYHHIQRVLFIVVNARARDNATVDQKVYPPGLIQTLLQIVDTSLDATILTTQDYLTAELEAINWRREQPQSHSPGTTAPAPDAATAATTQLKVGIVSIDFDMLTNDRCRRAFASMPTNWSLNGDAVKALKALPASLLATSEDLRRFYEDYHSQPAQLIAARAAAPSVLDAACDHAEVSVKADSR